MGQDSSSPTRVGFDTPPRTLERRSLRAVADYIQSGEVKHIVVMTGAGISTAAGIPDFRSPDTGLYAQLGRLNLPYAEAVFDISFFRQRPEPFYVLARELYPGKFHPTITHVFLALLAKKGLLFHLFTQNIDCLERAAGVPPERLVEAHGSFATQRCIDCKTEFPDDKMHEHVEAGRVPRCEKEGCGGLVKPDIVFFGEALPEAFSSRAGYVGMADLALVMGTSLAVHPFAALPEMVKQETPRVLFNLERAGHLGSRPDDVVELGACDDGVRLLAEYLGWKDELEADWRALVGDEEAEKQLARAREQKEGETGERPGSSLDDLVDRLAGEVEEVLKFDENDDEVPRSADDGEGAREVGGKSPETDSGDKSKAANEVEDGGGGPNKGDEELVQVSDVPETSPDSAAVKDHDSKAATAAPGEEVTQKESKDVVEGETKTKGLKHETEVEE